MIHGTEERFGTIRNSGTEGRVWKAEGPHVRGMFLPRVRVEPLDHNRTDETFFTEYIE
jgi:hypothetical protein